MRILAPLLSLLPSVQLPLLPLFPPVHLPGRICPLLDEIGKLFRSKSKSLSLEGAWSPFLPRPSPLPSIPPCINHRLPRVFRDLFLRIPDPPGPLVEAEVGARQFG